MIFWVGFVVPGPVAELYNAINQYEYDLSIGHEVHAWAEYQIPQEIIEHLLTPEGTFEPAVEVMGRQSGIVRKVRLVLGILKGVYCNTQVKMPKKVPIVGGKPLPLSWIGFTQIVAVLLLVFAFRHWRMR